METLQILYNGKKYQATLTLMEDNKSILPVTEDTTSKESNNDFDCIQYLIDKDILKKEYLYQPKQHNFIEEFKTAHNQLGTKQYILTVNSALNDNEKSKKRNLKGYVLWKLQDEVRKWN